MQLFSILAAKDDIFAPARLCRVSIASTAAGVSFLVPLLKRVPPVVSVTNVRSFLHSHQSSIWFA